MCTDSPAETPGTRDQPDSICPINSRHKKTPRRPKSSRGHAHSLIPCGNRLGSTGRTLALTQSVGSRILAAIRERSDRSRTTRELVGEEGNGVTDIDLAIVGCVGCVRADHRIPTEEEGEDLDTVSNVDSTVVVGVTANELSLLTGVGDSVVVGVRRTSSDIAAVVDAVLVTIRSTGLVEVTLVRDSVTVDVVVTSVDRTVTVGVGLAAVVLAVSVTVRSTGLIDIAGVRDSVAVDVVVTGVDRTVTVGIGLAAVVLAVRVTVGASSNVDVTGVRDSVAVDVVVTGVNRAVTVIGLKKSVKLQLAKTPNSYRSVTKLSQK